MWRLLLCVIFCFAVKAHSTIYNNGEFVSKIIETETHLHSYERWFGAAAEPSGETHVADRINKDITAFQTDAGNDDWGNWLQILGSGDTPAVAGKAAFDIHRVYIKAVERNTSLYLIQIGFGTSGAAALSANTYTELVFTPQSVTAEEVPLEMQVDEVDAGTKVWIRICVPDQDTGTMDFYIGLHEYDN